MEHIIQQTADGSATLFVPDMDEHYHSVKGARTESQHIFIEMGLRASHVPKPHVLEMGFGTGLNAWLTLLAAEADRREVHYTTLERYPLSPEEADALHYADSPLFRQLHTAPWETDVRLTPWFTLRKLKTDVLSYHPTEMFDVVYWDAFAPEKQPEMWGEPLLQTICHSMNPGGLLTTYCAKGCVRRRLQSIGFCVERLPGPPGGKREMIRATAANRKC